MAITRLLQGQVTSSRLVSVHKGNNVRMVELGDTMVLETIAERRVGSNPTLDTINGYAATMASCVGL